MQANQENNEPKKWFPVFEFWLKIGIVADAAAG